MELEIWKELDGFEGRYQVSNLGRVKTVLNIQRCWSRKTGDWQLIERKEKVDRVRACFLNNSGYLRVALRENDKMKDYLVHRLIAKTFIPNPENKRFINHKNGDKTDNRVENLEWCTHKENMEHAVKKGLSSGRKKINK